MNEQSRTSAVEGQTLSGSDARALYYYARLAGALRREWLATLGAGSEVPRHHGGSERDMLSAAGTYALLPQDIVAPAPYTAAAALVRGAHPARLRSLETSPNLPFDVSDPSLGLLPPTREHGAGLSPAVGAALAAKQRSERRIVLAHLSSSVSETGEFHESLNTAAVLHVPLVVLVERDERKAFGPAPQGGTIPASRAAAFGVPVRQILAEDLVELYTGIRQATSWARDAGETVLLEVALKGTEHFHGDSADSGKASEDSSTHLREYLVDRQLISDIEAVALDGKVEAELAQPLAPHPK